MRPPDWIGRIADISTEVGSLPDSDSITRNRFELIFKVSRSRAAEMMRQFGGESKDGTLTIRKTTLLGALAKYAETPAMKAEIDLRAVTIIIATRSGRDPLKTAASWTVL